MGVKSTKGADCGGMRKLSDLRLRCRIDDETGCWSWSMARDGEGCPRCYAPAGVLGPRPKVTTAARLAWKFAGHDLPPGHYVYPTCRTRGCCNPKHLAAATRSVMFRFMAEDGSMSSPERCVINARNNAKQVLEREKFDEVMRLLELGEMRTRIVEQTGVGRDTVRKIARGIHRHNRPAVPGASVFAWAANRGYEQMEAA